MSINFFPDVIIFANDRVCRLTTSSERSPVTWIALSMFNIVSPSWHIGSRVDSRPVSWRSDKWSSKSITRRHQKHIEFRKFWNICSTSLKFLRLASNIQSTIEYVRESEHTLSMTLPSASLRQRRLHRFNFFFATTVNSVLKNWRRDYRGLLHLLMEIILPHHVKRYAAVHDKFSIFNFAIRQRYDLMSLLCPTEWPKRNCTWIMTTPSDVIFVILHDWTTSTPSKIFIRQSLESLVQCELRDLSCPCRARQRCQTKKIDDNHFSEIII